MPSVLFVCLGNICRSPTAEAVFRQKATQAGLDVEIDSAGTSGAHDGQGPDPRSVNVGEARGYSFDGQRSRRVSRKDFVHYDYILAMDSYNLSHLRRTKPKDARTHPRLFLDFAEGVLDRNVPDPYYGGNRGFDEVLDLIELASEGLIADIRANSQTET